MKQAEPVFRMMASVTLLVVTVGVLGLAYVHWQWGREGVLLAVAFSVGVPLFLLVGLLMSGFLLISQRIWARSADAQVGGMRELFRSATQATLLQRQRERLEPLQLPEPERAQSTSPDDDGEWRWRDGEEPPPLLSDMQVER